MLYANLVVIVSDYESFQHNNMQIIVIVIVIKYYKQSSFYSYSIIAIRKRKYNIQYLFLCPYTQY